MTHAALDAGAAMSRRRPPGVDALAVLDEEAAAGRAVGAGAALLGVEL